MHAKGAGAHGYFEVTSPVLAQYSKAKLFATVGKRTPTFLRFSTVGGEKGSADTDRAPRGFALKFYTEEGIRKSEKTAGGMRNGRESAQQGTTRKGHTRSARSCPLPSAPSTASCALARPRPPLP